MTIHTHREMIVWQKSIELVKRVYGLTKSFPREEIYGLTAQLRRAAVSIPANIAEGHARSGRRDYAHFLVIARGSLNEVDTLIELALSLEYTSRDKLNQVFGLMDEVGRMLNKLYNSLRD
jgi:four helix bundle protein